jgi:membrane protease subunit HflC
MTKKLILSLAAFVVVVIVAASSLFIVKEGEYKVILKFGEAVRVEQTPGLYIKIPFIESVSKLPKYQMTYESNPTQILTKDNKPIIVDNY